MNQSPQIAKELEKLEASDIRYDAACLKQAERATPEALRALKPFVPIAAFVEAYPPRNRLGFLTRKESVVYQSTGKRLVISEQCDPDPGNGLWRSEELSKRNFNDAELDSVEFSGDLVKALADGLSIRNLQHLVASFQKELDEQLAIRKENVICMSAIL